MSMDAFVSPTAPLGTAAHHSARGQSYVVVHKHCRYSLNEGAERTIVWCQPRSEQAQGWMARRGVCAQRVICTHASAGPWILRREMNIEANVQVSLDLFEPAIGHPLPRRLPAAGGPGCLAPVLSCSKQG